MKKKLLAAAVAAVVAAPGAAQAEVKISGLMDLSYNFIDNDTTGAAVDGEAHHISSNNSRLIFKGSEDLGGGLKAIWQVGSVIAVDAGGATLNSRNTFIGLVDDWGQVRLGRHETPYKMVGRKVDLFDNRQLGENRILVTPNAGFSPSPVFSQDKRAPNSANYFTPVINGFQGAIAYLPEEGIDDGDAWSLSAGYTNGPLYLALGYEVVNEGYFGATEEVEGLRLAGSYKFGDFRVVGMYQDVSDDLGVSGNDWDVWGLGGAYTFGNNTIKGQYYDRDGDNAISNQDASMFSIGLDHKFSKRTKLYVTYARVDNENGARFTVNSQGFDQGNNNTGAGVGFGDDSSGLAIGLSHKF